MKRAIALVAVLLVSCAAPDEERPIPDVHYAEAHAALPMGDGFLVGGLADLDMPPEGSDACGRSRAWLGWVDSSGRLLRHLDLEPERAVLGLAPLDDGFLACGPSWYGLFDRDGRPRAIRTSTTDWRAAARGEDGGILLAGEESGGPAFALRLDGKGEEVERRAIVPAHASARDACAAPGGGWAVVGWRWESGPAVESWLLRLDSGGNVLWAAAFRDDPEVHAQAVAAFEDGFLVAGFSGPSEALRGWIRRLDASGREVWLRGFAPGDLVELAVAGPDAAYVAGRRESEGFLARVEADGRMTGERTFPGRFPFAAASDPAGGAILLGGLGTGGLWIERVGP